MVLLHSLCNWRYLSGDPYLQQKDVAAHLKVCTKFLLQARDVIRSGASPWARFMGLASLFHQESIPMEHIWIWPRLVYAVSAPAAALWDLTPRVIILSNSIWLTVLLLSVYFIGARCMSPEAGFLSALTASLFPATYGLSRNYGLDFPLMAVVALSIYWLIRTEGFSRRLPSIVLGCAMGLGLLVKMQLIIFICGPLAFALVIGMARAFKGGAPPCRVLANAALAGLAAVLLSSPFWWGNIDNIMLVFIRHAAQIKEFEGYVDIDPHYLASFVLSPQYFAYYPVAAVVYVSPPLCALGILLLPVFLRSRFKSKAIVLLWIVAPYALFTIIEIKYSVFYLPSLPAVACIIGVGLSSIRRKALKYTLCAAAFGWGLFHFAQLSFSLGPAPYGDCRPYSSNALRPDGYPVWAHPAFPNNLERVARSFIEEISAREQGNKYVRIGICEFEYSDRDYLLVDSLEYFMESVNPCMYVYRSYFSADSFLECMDSFNFIIVLEKGEKALPDLKEFEGYFTEGRGAGVRKKYLKNEEDFLRLTKNYLHYEILDSDLLLPSNISAFLLRKPPFPVGDSAVIPATHLYSANVYIAYPYIGIAKELLHSPTIGDYDVLFPYDLDFPLVPPDRRDPSEPYYSLYQLSFESGGDYGISVGLVEKSMVSLAALVNGREVKQEAPYAGQDAPGDTMCLGSFSVDKGVNNIELVGENGFPVIQDLRIRKLSGQRAGGQ